MMCIANNKITAVFEELWYCFESDFELNMSTMSSSMHGSMDFETPNPTRSFELPGSDIQREGILKKLKVNWLISMLHTVFTIFIHSLNMLKLNIEMCKCELV